MARIYNKLLSMCSCGECNLATKESYYLWKMNHSSLYGKEYLDFCLMDTYKDYPLCMLVSRHLYHRGVCYLPVIQKDIGTEEYPNINLIYNSLIDALGLDLGTQVYYQLIVYYSLFPADSNVGLGRRLPAIAALHPAAFYIVMKVLPSMWVPSGVITALLRNNISMAMYLFDQYTQRIQDRLNHYGVDEPFEAAAHSVLDVIIPTMSDEVLLLADRLSDCLDAYKKDKMDGLTLASLFMSYAELCNELSRVDAERKEVNIRSIFRSFSLRTKSFNDDIAILRDRCQDLEEVMDAVAIITAQDAIHYFDKEQYQYRTWNNDAILRLKNHIQSGVYRNVIVMDDTSSLFPSQLAWFSQVENVYVHSSSSRTQYDPDDKIVYFETKEELGHLYDYSNPLVVMATHSDLCRKTYGGLVSGREPTLYVRTINVIQNRVDERLAWDYHMYPHLMTLPFVDVIQEDFFCPSALAYFLANYVCGDCSDRDYLIDKVFWYYELMSNNTNMEYNFSVGMKDRSCDACFRCSRILNYDLSDDRVNDVYCINCDQTFYVPDTITDDLVYSHSKDLRLPEECEKDWKKLREISVGIGLLYPSHRSPENYDELVDNIVFGTVLNSPVLKRYVVYGDDIVTIASTVMSFAGNEHICPFKLSCLGGIKKTERPLAKQKMMGGEATVKHHIAYCDPITFTL